MDKELKPCPFCGGAAVFLTEAIKRTILEEEFELKCGCPKCNFFFTGRSTYALGNILRGTATYHRVWDGVAECADAWNRRTKAEGND